MAGPHPAVAAVRVAVRAELKDVARSGSQLVLVAISGGADSTALAAATAFEAPRAGLRAGALTVDHAWSPDSRERAERVAALVRALGLDPVEILPAPTRRSENEARDARRAALAAAADRLKASAVLLGHSLDDQAETVLLRLARGSGSRSLAGMPTRDGLIRRPVLGLRRELLREACAADGLAVWDDPANDDPAFLRSRVRGRLIPELTAVLGPGAVPALARTADLLRADADALDAAAARVRSGADPCSVEVLGGLDAAVRARVLRAEAIARGCPPTDLSAGHVAALDTLVTAWHGQGPLSLPGGLVGRRRDGRIEVVPGRGVEADDGEGGFPHG